MLSGFATNFRPNHAKAWPPCISKFFVWWTVALAFPKSWSSLSELVHGLPRKFLKFCPNAVSSIHRDNRGACNKSSLSSLSIEFTVVWDQYGMIWIGKWLYSIADKQYSSAFPCPTSHLTQHWQPLPPKGWLLSLYHWPVCLQLFQNCLHPLIHANEQCWDWMGSCIHRWAFAIDLVTWYFADQISGLGAIICSR